MQYLNVINVSGVFFSGHILYNYVMLYLCNAVPFIKCKMCLLCCVAVHRNIIILLVLLVCRLYLFILLGPLFCHENRELALTETKQIVTSKYLHFGRCLTDVTRN